MGMAFVNVRDRTKECGKPMDRGRMFDVSGTYYIDPVICDKPRGHEGLHGREQFGVWGEDWCEHD